jgi:hypothetical protein
MFSPWANRISWRFRDSAPYSRATNPLPGFCPFFGVDRDRRKIAAKKKPPAGGGLGFRPGGPVGRLGNQALTGILPILICHSFGPVS